MPDMSFIAAFANNPLTLSILLIAAITIVVIWKISPFFKDILERMGKGNDLINDNIKIIDTKVNTLVESDAMQAEHIRLNTLDVLRITVYNENIDAEDRLIAAKRYFIRGGNGKVASYVKRLIAKYPTEWKTILAIVSVDEKTKLEQIIKEAT
jgi:hypothetical protein